jgi:CheY-like chemotaxis protein/HPt (histidine-containing phosphotransfer) domain-containing protein
VVDDNATNRQILYEVLTHWRMKPALVDGGRAALAAMKRASGAGLPFPLILLDAAMPEMDGFTVAAQINQVPELAGTAILMLSSFDLYRDTERCRELGIAVFVRKPIKESDLLDAISSTLSGRHATRAQRSRPRHEARPARAQSLRILLAEDHPVNQRLAVALLENAGHSVVVAVDGQDALENLDRESFDLVLMDVQMPRMDGFQATAAIRAAEKGTGRHMKIIAMTAHAMKGDQERCLAAGMDGYISKPLQAAHFLKVIEGRDKQADVKETEAALEPVVFDREEALERALGDHELLREMASLFLADCPGLLAEFRSGLDIADGQMLELAAHRMKGSAANLSAPRVVALCGRLEELARGGRLAAARSVFDELEHEVGRLGDALEVLKGTSPALAY